MHKISAITALFRVALSYNSISDLSLESLATSQEFAVTLRKNKKIAILSDSSPNHNPLPNPNSNRNCLS